MAVFQMPVQSAWGQNVRANAGAKLYFYEPGTLTPKATYSDFSETILQSHPVVADGEGRFPVIYFSGGYKVVFTDSNDVQQWTADDVFSTSDIVNFKGNFDSATNGGDYPATGNKGDLYVVSTGFTLNPASGSHRLFTGDFIIANKNNAIGIDADWDTIKGTKVWLDEDDMISNSNALAPSQQSVVAHTGVSNWFSTVTYAIGDTVRASDFKLYKAKTININQNPVGDLVNWEPANIIDNLTTNDATQSLSAAQGKVIGDQLIPATKTTIGFAYLNDQRITFHPSLANPAQYYDFNPGKFIFSDGSGEKVIPDPRQKRTDVLFSYGNNGGTIDVLPKVANRTYHVYSVHNPTTGLSCYATSTNVNGPSQVGGLVGYTKWTLIGSFISDGGANNLGFIQIARDFILDYNVCVFNFGPGGFPAGRQIILLTDVISATPAVPLGREVIALLSVHLWKSSGAGATDAAAIFTDLNQPVDTPTVLGVPIFDFRLQASAGTYGVANIQREVVTNALGQVGLHIVTGAVNNIGVFINVQGWRDFQIQ